MNVEELFQFVDYPETATAELLFADEDRLFMNFVGPSVNTIAFEAGNTSILRRARGRFSIFYDVADDSVITEKKLFDWYADKIDVEDLRGESGVVGNSENRVIDMIVSKSKSTQQLVKLQVYKNIISKVKNYRYTVGSMLLFYNQDILRTLQGMYGSLETLVRASTALSSPSSSSSLCFVRNSEALRMNLINLGYYSDYFSEDSLFTHSSFDVDIYCTLTADTRARVSFLDKVLSETKKSVNRVEALLAKNTKMLFDRVRAFCLRKYHVKDVGVTGEIPTIITKAYFTKDKRKVLIKSVLPIRLTFVGGTEESSFLRNHYVGLNEEEVIREKRKNIVDNLLLPISSSSSSPSSSSRLSSSAQESNRPNADQSVIIGVDISNVFVHIEDDTKNNTDDSTDKLHALESSIRKHAYSINETYNSIVDMNLTLLHINKVIAERIVQNYRTFMVNTVNTVNTTESSTTPSRSVGGTVASFANMNFVWALIRKKGVLLRTYHSADRQKFTFMSIELIIMEQFVLLMIDLYRQRFVFIEQRVQYLGFLLGVYKNYINKTILKSSNQTILMPHNLLVDSIEGILRT
jgi:hypothetical protein